MEYLKELLASGCLLFDNRIFHGTTGSYLQRSDVRIGSNISFVGIIEILDLNGER